MGYSTLPGAGRMPLRDAVRLDLTWQDGETRSIVLFQSGGEHTNTTGDVHSIVSTGDDCIWIVSRVEHGMVKHMEDGCGPYCAAPADPLFLANARSVLTTSPYAIANEWRECMFSGSRYPC